MDYLLTDAQWARIAPLLPGRAGTSGGRGLANHRFVEAGLWLGAQWLPLAGPAGGVGQLVIAKLMRTS